MRSKETRPKVENANLAMARGSSDDCRALEFIRRLVVEIGGQRMTLKGGRRG